MSSFFFFPLIWPQFHSQDTRQTYNFTVITCAWTRWKLLPRAAAPLYWMGRSGISSPKNGRRANLVKNNPFLWPSESWNDVTQLLLMLCHLSISVLSFLFITCILLCVLFSYLFLFSHSGHSLEKLPKSLILASKTGSNLAILARKFKALNKIIIQRMRHFLVIFKDGATI